MKNKNSQGIVTLPILIYCLLLMGLVLGYLPTFTNSDHILVNEENRLQASYNAEAGVWIGLREWKKTATTLALTTYLLPSGQAQVKIELIDAQTIKIVSYGATRSARDGIEAIYSVPQEQFVHWHKIVQQ